MNLQEAYSGLLTSGKWEYKSKFVKENCSKCYDRKHLGFNLTTKTYVPCSCIFNKLKVMKEDEEKRTIQSISIANIESVVEKSNENNT